MTICCGTERNTPFCSMCGNELNGQPLWSLLRHCRVKRDTQKKQLETDGDYYKQHPGKLRAKKDVIAKWTLWVDALEKLLKEPTDER
ncbi:hypothetical protein LCGC14_1289800 [marine sediment metagenome]|uniref:Uncharacterized protein n=1 Tax=marine sediment metagenome TaxID=412755 RepID=A0A0F9KUH1_9ZZZZ